MADGLFEGFSPSDLEQWKQLVTKELKGVGPEGLALWKASDGYKALPAYFREETEKLPLFGQTLVPLRFNQIDNSWLICTDVYVKTAKQANKDILYKLSLGVSALTIDLNGKDFARDEIETMLKGVVVNAISISFRNAFNALRFQADYFDWAHRVGIGREELRGGMWFDSLNGDLAVALLRDGRFHGFGTFGLDCSGFQAQGANIPQQLGAALAWGNQVVNRLRERSVSFEQISNNIGFGLAIGPSFLPEVAKFRLIRFLWARVMQQHGASAKRWKTWVHAQTGENHFSPHDTPVNLLRGNAQAMSAVMGSVDCITVHPFDTEQPELAERMAINTQHLMSEEAGLHRVIDPAAGSYYVEHLTDIIGRHAWEFFKKIEEMGGYTVANATGFLAEEFDRTDAAYSAEVQNLDRILVGVNKYPSPFDK
jgi:methylmalonyl-CoA mutase